MGLRHLASFSSLIGQMTLITWRPQKRLPFYYLNISLSSKPEPINNLNTARSNDLGLNPQCTKSHCPQKPYVSRHKWLFGYKLANVTVQR